MATVTIGCAIRNGLILQTSGGGPLGFDPIVLAGPPLVPSAGAGLMFAPGGYGTTAVDSAVWSSWSAAHPQLVTPPGGAGVWQVS